MQHPISGEWVRICSDRHYDEVSHRYLYYYYSPALDEWFPDRNEYLQFITEDFNSVRDDEEEGEYWEPDYDDELIDRMTGDLIAKYGTAKDLLEFNVDKMLRRHNETDANGRQDNKPWTIRSQHVTENADTKGLETLKISKHASPQLHDFTLDKSSECKTISAKQKDFSNWPTVLKSTLTQEMFHKRNYSSKTNPIFWMQLY